MGNCAGIDWASEKHDVLIEDPAGEELLAATFSHDEDGVSGAVRGAWSALRLRWSRSSARTGCWSIGCWRPGCGCWRCIPIRSRPRADRFRASGGKSDRFDRFVLCELARTDAHRFRVLEPDSDQTKALRALTRAREDLVRRGSRWPTSCAQSLSGSGPGRSACSAISTARSRSRSWSVIPARKTPAGWARSAWRRS